MSRLLFRRGDRIRHQHEFDRVFASRVYAADQALVVRGCRNGLGRCRLGLSVSRKAGNAVVRNRWKRLIREVFRAVKHELPDDIDFVVLPRRGAVPEYEAIRRSLPKLAKRIARQLQRPAS